MKTDLKDFIIVFEDMISSQDCKEAVIQLKAAQWKPHFFIDYENKTEEGGTEPMMTLDLIPQTDAIMRALIKAQNQYIHQELKTPWYGGCSRISHCKFHRYDQGKEMSLHCDHIHSLFDGEAKGIPVLTVIAALNEDYEGGELIVLDQEIELKQGEVVVFPSNFLFPHKVNPVKSGARYSCVSWAW